MKTGVIFLNTVINCSHTMDRIFIEEKTFEGNDFTVSGIEPANYENCRFINCNFSEVDLSGINFSECNFDGCNMGMAKLEKQDSGILYSPAVNYWAFILTIAILLVYGHISIIVF